MKAIPPVREAWLSTLHDNLDSVFYHYANLGQSLNWRPSVLPSEQFTYYFWTRHLRKEDLC